MKLHRINLLPNLLLCSKALGQSIIASNVNITADDAELTASMCDLGAFLKYIDDDELSAEVRERSVAASRLREELCRKRQRSSTSTSEASATKKGRIEQSTCDSNQLVAPSLMAEVNASRPGTSHVRVYHSATTLLLDPDTPDYSLSIATPTTAAALKNLSRRVDVQWAPFHKHLLQLGIPSPGEFFDRLAKLERRFTQR